MTKKRDKKSWSMPKEADFTTSHLKEITGISTKQLADWDEKGLLPNCDREEGQWRRFDLSEIMIMFIMSEFRNRWGISLDSLKWLSHRMAETGTDYFTEVMTMAMDSQAPILLITDFNTFLRIGDSVVTGDFIRSAFLDHDGDDSLPAGGMILKLTPLLNRLLELLGLPMRFNTSTDLIQLFEGFNELRCAQTGQEYDLLQLVRDPQLKELQVVLKKGDIKRFQVITSHGNLTPEELVERLKSKEFGKTQISQQNGKIVCVVDEKSIKYE